jgi:RNA polymerase sigma-70 factor (sigma-E family)
MQPTVRDEEFRSFVTGHRSALLRAATFLTAGDGFAAEDLVQSALMRVYVAWPRVRTGTAEAYARKAVLNALVDDRRRAFTRRELVTEELPEPIAVPHEADGDAALHAALAQLPPRMRAAVVLRYFCDLSVAETARELECSEGTVKSQTARALAHLRAALDLPTTTREAL